MNSPIEYDIDIIKKIPTRPLDAHKGSCGHALIIAGSKGMSGAAFLSAIAAYRTGAGLVRILTVEDNRVILQTLLPEAIIDTYDPDDIIKDNDIWKDILAKSLDFADVIVIGPGIGRDTYVSKLVEDVLKNAFVPMIIDADALDAIANYPYLTTYYTDNIIITPHMLEMAKLIGKDISEIKSDAMKYAITYRDTYDITCILKSHITYIATSDGKIYKNTSGVPALAKGGTGDVLTGIIAGLICIGMDINLAASIAPYIHGLAGKVASQRYGMHGILSRDVASAIPSVMKLNYDSKEGVGIEKSL